MNGTIVMVHNSYRCSAIAIDIVRTTDRIQFATTCHKGTACACLMHTLPLKPLVSMYIIHIQPSAWARTCIPEKQMRCPSLFWLLQKANDKIGTVVLPLPPAT